MGLGVVEGARELLSVGAWRAELESDRLAQERMRGAVEGEVEEERLQVDRRAVVWDPAEEVLDVLLDDGQLGDLGFAETGTDEALTGQPKYTLIIYYEERETLDLSQSGPSAVKMPCPRNGSNASFRAPRLKSRNCVARTALMFSGSEVEMNEVPITTAEMVGPSSLVPSKCRCSETPSRELCCMRRNSDRPSIFSGWGTERARWRPWVLR